MMRVLRCLIFSALIAVAPVAAAQAPPADPSTTEQAAGTAEQPLAQDGEAARLAFETSNEIYSPFCPGKTLAMCTSGQAAEVRREIQVMASSGMSKDEIKEKVIGDFGEEYRYVVPDSFDNAWILAVIALGLLFAIGVVFMITRRGSQGPADDQADAANLPAPSEVEDDDPYLKELRDRYKS